MAIIADTNLHPVVVAFFSCGTTLQRLRGQAPAIRHRFNGIQRQIHQYLLQLIRIGDDLLMV